MVYIFLHHFHLDSKQITHLEYYLNLLQLPFYKVTLNKPTCYTIGHQAARNF